MADRVDESAQGGLCSHKLHSLHPKAITADKQMPIIIHYEKLHPVFHSFHESTSLNLKQTEGVKNVISFGCASWISRANEALIGPNLFQNVLGVQGFCSGFIFYP